MICKTCGENEAINDFYEECEGCIDKFQKEKYFMCLPLENKDHCYIRFYPKCLGIRTKCPSLTDCHHNYSGTTRHGNETLGRIMDAEIRFWKRALILFLFLPPIIVLIWSVMTL